MNSKTKENLFVAIQFSCIGLLVFYTGVFGSIVQNLFILLAIALGLWGVKTMKFDVNIRPQVREEQVFYGNGPYRFIRHPMYSSLLLITATCVTEKLDLLSVSLWLILLIDLLLKLHYEESLLNKHFKNYDKYSKKTKKLIPFVY